MPILRKMPTYLEQLTLRLAAGSDLYYTGFGLRGLAILGELHGEPAQRAARFLRSRMQGQESIIDFLSLIYGGKLLEAAAGVNVFGEAAANWQSSVAGALLKLR